MRVGWTHLFFGTINFPNSMGTTLVDLSPWWMSSITFFLPGKYQPSASKYPRQEGLVESVTEEIRTTWSSQLSPSDMYLKHLSHTHNIDFSPAPWLRPRPPARMSDVRPCERRDERATPGIRGGAEPVCDPLGVETCSSISVSVRGYGEKYLNDSPHYHKLNK